MGFLIILISASLFGVFAVFYNNHLIAKIESKEKRYNHLASNGFPKMNPWRHPAHFVARNVPKQVEINWNEVPTAVEVALNPPKFPEFKQPFQKLCVGCDKPTKYEYENYCNFNCMIDMAKKQGGKIIAPNNLPITCIDKNWTMLEHEAADHQDYLFPIYVECTDKKMIEEDPSIQKIEFHAIIHGTTDYIVTLYETCLTLWSVHDGKCLGGFNERYKWKLTEDSLKQVQEKFNNEEKI